MMKILIGHDGSQGADEAALHGNTDVASTISAKTIYRTLKRLNVTDGQPDRTLLIGG